MRLSHLSFDDLPSIDPKRKPDEREDFEDEEFG